MTVEAVLEFFEPVPRGESTFADDGPMVLVWAVFESCLREEFGVGTGLFGLRWSGLPYDQHRT